MVLKLKDGRMYVADVFKCVCEPNIRLSNANTKVLCVKVPNAEIYIVFGLGFSWSFETIK